jgi:hypothetical protein
MSKGEAAKKVCFVIGPIGDAGTDTRRHADWLLEGIVEPVFNTHFQDFIVERSGKISAPGSISSQIIIRLHTAELVIADMSQANANAFYEMGIRHMKRLPTIHMFSEGQNIPFDVKPYRAIPFKCAEPKDLKAAQAALKAAIEEAIKPGFVVDNPVTQARGVEKLEETATPEQRVLLDQVQQIQRRLDEMENVRRAPGRTGDLFGSVDTDIDTYIWLEVKLANNVEWREIAKEIVHRLPDAVQNFAGKDGGLRVKLISNANTMVRQMGLIQHIPGVTKVDIEF